MVAQLTLVPEEPPRLTPMRLPIREITLGLAPPLDSAFVESVRRWGILQPPVVRLRGETAQIVDGRRRVAALLSVIPAHENPRIECLSLVGDASPEVLALMLNDQRSSNPVSDLAAIEQLVAAGASEHDIQQATGMAVPTIRKRMSLKRLHYLWREEFDAGHIAVTIAERLATLPSETQQGLHALWTIEGRLTHADIRAARMVRMREAVAQLPDTLFEEVSPSAADIAIMYPADHLLTPEEARLPEYGGSDTRSWYERSRDFTDMMLSHAPTDVPVYVRDVLSHLERMLRDLAESQAPGFLTDEERVDISDVVPIDDTPYDEDAQEGVTTDGNNGD